MFPNRRSFLQRLAFGMRIAAILFLFALVLSAWAAPQTGRKKPVKAKTAATTVSPGNPAKSGPASKRDADAAARDSTLPAKTADSTRNRALQKGIDPSTAGAAASAVRDTSRKQEFGDADTGSALVAGNGRAGDRKQTTGKQNARERQPAAGAALSGRAILSRLPILLIIAVAVGAGTAVIVMAARNRRDRRRFLTTTRLSVMDKEVQKACRYIEQHYADPTLTAKSVCEALVTGESFLEVLMERNLGMGLVDFITHVRVNGAKMILGRNPAASMESVAKEAGFADEALFGATFRKVTGVSFDSYTRPDGKGARPHSEEPAPES